MLCYCSQWQNCHYGLNPFSPCSSHTHDSANCLYQHSSLQSHSGTNMDPDILVIKHSIKHWSPWIQCRQTLPLLQSLHTGRPYPCTNWQRNKIGNAFHLTGAHLRWLSSKRPGKAVVRQKNSHWILDSPLARRSLKGTVERDTVKGSLCRPKARMSSLCTAQVTVFIREADVRPANSMLYRKTM